MQASKGGTQDTQNESAVEATERKTRAWLADVVVGLNLCPFARPVLGSDALRIEVSQASDPEGIARALVNEIAVIQNASEADVATTLVVFPNALAEFETYLEFLDNAELLLQEMNLRGVLQLASFHPDYQFAGEPIDATSHFTNRAPFPIIHILREAMVTRALEGFPNPEEIPKRNILTLEGLGHERIQAMLTALG
jgi:hypothetical protein